jgi:hypothetical protein
VTKDLHALTTNSIVHSFFSSCLYFLIILFIGWVGADNVGQEADASWRPRRAPPVGVNMEV